MENSDFNIYTAKISVQVTRVSGPYSSDSLADITLNEEFPLAQDVTLLTLMQQVRNRFIEVESKIENVLDARGEFERKVQLALDPPADVDNVFGE